MSIDIYIREKSGSREIRIPVLPEVISFKSGEATFVSYDIMGLGEVATPTGTKLSGYTWRSLFPGALQSNTSMQRGEWKDPNHYHNILEDWKASGTLLNLMVTCSPINADVYVKAYDGELSGAFGDIPYEITFSQARDITITATKIEAAAPTTPDSTKRPETTPSKYTIKSGDTLWAIAKKFYKAGSKWKTIYNANKTIIEKAAKKHGRKSSSNGHWIYPGTVIKIP